MTNEKFIEIVSKQMETCLLLLGAKGAEYSLEQDRLIAFKRAANLQGENMKQALAGMMAKHVISIYDMCISDDTFSDERWTEKITDTMNYLLLLKAVIEEEKDG